VSVISVRLGGEPGVTLDRVDFSYDGHKIISGVSWELSQGQNAVITGSSGCGKSTFLQIAAGLLPTDRGSVLLAGHPVKKLLPSERLRRGLRTGFVFQDGGLFSNMDVQTNVSLALDYHRDLLELDDAMVEQRTKEALEAARISKVHWHSLPAHLSFGDKKRLALARAFALKPNFFFFDDTDVANDQLTAKITHQVLCELRDDPAITLLVATNRSNLIDRLGIPGFLLENGQLRTNTRTSLFPTM
jgi:ABC-type transporter Mla maintaining outer membrane lipid asymmetry ATPase subunit MlaF